MTVINTKKLHETARGLTQAWQIGMSAEHIPVTEQSLARVFPNTLAASFSSEVLLTIGEGMMSADTQSKILSQYAFDRGLPVAEVGRAYVELVGMLGRSPLIFRELIAGVIGTNDRPARTSNVASVTPTVLFTRFEKILTDAGVQTEAVYIHLLVDFVANLIRPFGWVVNDSGYSYRVRRPNVFPRYKDVVDMLSTRELNRILGHLARADMSAVKRMIDTKNAVSPSMVSTHMTSAMLQAYDLSKSSYDGHAVATSVLTTLYRIWNPSTPEELRPSPRMYKNEIINSLLGNLGLFLAAQNMAKEAPGSMMISFDDEEMSSVILPTFQEALANSATYKIRVLSDTVDFLGKKSANDPYGAPLHTVIYEGFDARSTMEAFVPVRQLRRHGSKYLVPQIEVSNALNNVLSPIAAYMHVDDIVEQRLQSLSLDASESRGHDNGVNVHLALPSLIERELRSGMEVGLLSRFLAGDEMPEEPLVDTDGTAIPSELTKVEFESLRYDYYSLLMHYAMSELDGQTAFVVSVEGDQQRNIALAWEGRTQLKHPLGQSAILHGLVTTSEPLEAIVYRRDATNRKDLKTFPVDLRAHEKNVHLWNWESQSRKLDFKALYTARINNKQMEVLIRENELLGLGVHRDNLFYLLPRNMAAVTRLWSDWIVSIDDLVKTKSSLRKSDPLVREAYHGLRLQTGVSLVRMLSNLGTTGVGARINTLARRRMAEQLYSEGHIDDAAQLTVGIQQARLNVWAGLTALGLLGLLTEQEITKIFNLIRETQAMTMFVDAASIR